MSKKIESFVKIDYDATTYFGSGSISIDLKLDGKPVSAYPELETGYRKDGFAHLYSVNLPVEFLRKIKEVKYTREAYPGGKTSFEGSGYRFFRKFAGVDLLRDTSHDGFFHQRISKGVSLNALKGTLMQKHLGVRAPSLYQRYREMVKEIRLINLINRLDFSTRVVALNHWTLVYRVQYPEFNRLGYKTIKEQDFFSIEEVSKFISSFD